MSLEGKTVENYYFILDITLTVWSHLGASQSGCPYWVLKVQMKHKEKTAPIITVPSGDSQPSETFGTITMDQKTRNPCCCILTV